VKEYSKVDTSKLVKASPSDLQVGETYYILDNNTHEKKIGVYLRKEEYDKDDEDDDYLTVGYWFKIKDKDTGRIYEGEVQGYQDDDGEIFDDVYSVFIPQSKKIITEKLEGILPSDVTGEITKHLGGGAKSKKSRKSKKSKKSRKSRKSKKSKKSKKSRKSRK
jgi:hypothetical protein